MIIVCISLKRRIKNYSKWVVRHLFGRPTTFLEILAKKNHFQPTTTEMIYMAYFDVHSLAVLSCLALSVLSNCAISGTKGSSGLGSVRREQIESNTLLIVNAGLH